MSRIKILAKALKISIQIKGFVSISINMLGFLFVLMPILLAKQLQALTDELQLLTGGAGNQSATLKIFLSIVILYVIQVVFTNLQMYMNGLDEVKVKHYIKYTIMRHKCEVSYKYIENYDNFQKRIAFANEIAGHQMAKSIGSILTILQLFFSMALIGFTLWKVNPYIVVALLITSIPAALLSYFQQDETLRHRAKWMEEGALAIHFFTEISGEGSLDALQEIRHFALFDYLKARWRAIADEYIGKKNKIMAKHVKYNAAADFLRSIVYMGILLATGWEVYHNPAIGLGVFTLVYTLSGQLQTVTGDCLVDIMVLMQSIPYIEEFFRLEELEREPKGEEVSLVNSGDIKFENVTFSYPNGKEEVLKNISVHIKEGEKIAIVGDNGSGKSTFVSLLCGMFQPGKGQIQVGGLSVSKDPVTVRNAISVVYQDFAHYEASLRDNITVSDRSRKANDQEIMELLHKINVNEVIEEQPAGLDELIGSFSEKANNLSGGQWQKISIARAAYRNKAKIMILDEPTSALDPIAEAQLYKNFTNLTGDKTTVLISHRLGITSLVDRILVFRAGRIIEDGSHKQLMDRNGYYAQMYRAQAQWYA